MRSWRWWSSVRGRRGLAAGVAGAVAALACGAGCGPLSSSSSPSSSSSSSSPSSRSSSPSPPPLAGEDQLSGTRTSGAPARDELPATARPLGYRLHLDVDPQARSFGGEATIDVELSAPSRQLELHAVALAIESVELGVAGGRWQAAGFARTASRLRVELGRERRGRLAVRVRYRGATTSDEQGLFRQEVAGEGYLYSQAEAQFARRILPCFDEPRHKVPWQVSVSAPAAARVFANGAELSDEPLAGGRHRVTFAVTPPMPSFLLAVAAGAFRVVELGAHGRGRFPVRLVLPAGLGDAASSDPQLARSIAPRAIAAVERWLDRPLPLEKLDVVAVPQFFGAMENPGLITMNAGDLLGERDDHGLAALLARVLVHELAHQWFGNQLTPASWGDLWISESLATWVAQQAFPELPELDATYARVGSQVAARSADAREPSPLRRDDLGPERMFDAISYDKGAAVLSMLAHWMGEARLRQALRRLLDERRDGLIDTEALAAALGEVEPAAEQVTLAAALRPGVPLLRFALACGEGKAASLQITRAEGRGPLPVCVRFAGPRRPSQGARVCGVIESEGALALPLPLGQCPAWLVSNDDLRGYYRARWPGQPDPRGPLPPLAAQTRAERLGLGWLLAGDLGAGTSEPALSAALFRAAVGELQRHQRLPRAAGSAELDLADLELIDALSRWVSDVELPAWDALVARRAAPMLSPQSLAGQSSELARARLGRMLEVLVDVPWPASLTAAAAARLARGWAAGSPAPAASLSSAFSPSSSAAARDWHLALRGAGPRPFAELVARSSDASLAAAAPLWLSWLPAAALPSLLAALDSGALRWSRAVPALVELLSRRATQRAITEALSLRGGALGRELAPVELTALLEAGRWLCSRQDGEVFARTFAPLVAKVSRGDETLAQVRAQAERCDDLRSWHYGARLAHPGGRLAAGAL